MADGDLTAKEFWKLPPDERMKRCGELSAHGAFVARLTDPGFSKAFVPCNSCIYKKDGAAACKAFPEGIPADHIRSVMKDQTIDCGNGFHFEGNGE